MLRTLILIVLVGLLQAPASATSAPLPVEDFARRSEMQDLQVSPTGQYLAMTVPLDDGRVVLYVVDRVQLKKTATIYATGNNVIDTFWWANDTRVVATMARKDGGVDRPRATGELFAIDADGKNGKQIFGYRGESNSAGAGRSSSGGTARFAAAYPIGRIPGEDRQILISTRDFRSTEQSVPLIERLDIYTGRTTVIGKGPTPTATMIADNRGEVRAAFSMGVDQNAVFHVRSGNAAEWQVFNDSKFSKVWMRPLMFARDNRHAYVQISSENGPDGVYRVDLETRAQELLYRGGADPGPLLRTADQQDAYGVVTLDGETGVQVFDAASAEGRMTQSLRASFPGQAVRFSNFTRDGKYGLVAVFSDRNPGDFYFFDMAGKKADYLISRQRWIEPDAMAAMRPITLEASDGVRLHGYLTLPPQSDGKNLPLVVHPHGGPHGPRDVWGFDPQVQLLANRGYAVLQINFRGSGGYGRAFEESGYRQWGTRMQDDVTDATRWAIAEGYADPKRVCIYGASYGGYAALMGAVREPELYRCTIGYVGVYDLRMMHERGDIPGSLYGRRYLRMAVGDSREDMLQRSPVGNVDKIKAAVMLVHGGKDERVPIAQAQALRKALDARGTAYEWLVKDGEGHGFYLTENKVELYTQLLAFLDRHIGAQAAASSGK